MAKEEYAHDRDLENEEPGTMSVSEAGHRGGQKRGHRARELIDQGQEQAAPEQTEMFYERTPYQHSRTRDDDDDEAA